MRNVFSYLYNRTKNQIREDQQSKFLLRYELKIDYFLTLGKEEK